MAVESKISFLRSLEKRMGSVLTVDMLTRIMSIVSDVITGYELREVSIKEEQEDMLECFLQAMDVQGRSQKTIKHYKLLLGKLMDFTKVSAQRINVYHLRNYISKKKEEGLKDSTLEHFRSVFSAYFGWLHREGLIDKNPVVNLGTIKVAQKVKDVFSDIDMEKMRQGCKRLVDKAIICFLASTGCRVAELVGLDISAVDLENMECIVHGKGNKDRTVYMDAVTAMYVRNYLAMRHDDNDALFVNKFGDRFETGGIRDMLKRLEIYSGVKKIHPHKFRRTLATNLHKRGMPIQSIAAILGHSKIETTMKYIAITKDDTKLKYRQYYAC